MRLFTAKILISAVLLGVCTFAVAGVPEGISAPD